MKVKNNKNSDLSKRFVHNHNVVAKSITTLMFSLTLAYGKLQQLAGVPAEHGYFIVRHSFDSGLLFMIIALAIFGLYVSFTKRIIPHGKLIFLILGSGIWSAYAGLFLYRDLLFPHPPSLQSVLILAVAISFLLDVKAGDF